MEGDVGGVGEALGSVAVELGVRDGGEDAFLQGIAQRTDGAVVFRQLLLSDGRSGAEARRLRILPFTQKPVTPEVDLKKKLSAEREGVFNWMLGGLSLLIKQGAFLKEAAKAPH